MKLSVKRCAEPHAWFAWYPVTAEQRTPTGLMYFVVWLRTVQRSYIRVGGMSQTVYVTETK